MLISLLLLAHTATTSPSEASMPKLSEARAEVRQNIKTSSSNFESRREEFKLKLEQSKDRIKENREEFREKTKIIKDERKQEIVVNISDRINSINENTVSHWNDVITRLNEHLGSLQTKLDGATKDKTAAQSAINSAKASVISAQEAINTQAAKTYEIKITSEDTLRANTQAVLKQFKSDLAATRTKITDARQATLKALQETRKAI
jgi:hypothetical protein